MTSIYQDFGAKGGTPWVDSVRGGGNVGKGGGLGSGVWGVGRGTERSNRGNRWAAVAHLDPRASCFAAHVLCLPLTLAGMGLRNVQRVDHPETRPHDDHAAWRHGLHEVIFEAETSAGRVFDVVLMLLIASSVIAVMLESVEPIRQAHGRTLIVIEWIITVLFTIEYALRLISVRRAHRYALSFFGVVDLLAILPTYVGVLIPGQTFTQFAVVRALRLLRIFRVLKLPRFLSEANDLRAAIASSWAKIVVFLSTVVIVVTIMGSTMYVIEGGAGNEGFSSIPQSMYWAIVTMTTVGYGDAVPMTVAGKMIAAVVMVLGYSMIIVPTGIVSTEMAQAVVRRQLSTQHCPHCSREGHDRNARFCKFCGGELDPE